MSKDNVVKFPDVEMFGYTILSAIELSDLLQLIEGCIVDGWRPYGAAFVGPGGRGYCQGMRWIKPRSFSY